MGHKDHHEKARGPVTVFIITVSDTRTVETDSSGALIIEKLEAAGHIVAGREIVPDEPERILELLNRIPENAPAVIINGGTGISKRDRTYDTLEAQLDKVLPGFGELFRMLSYEEIGAAAIMSRAIAGISNDRVLISIPGSSGAVRLAMEKIIVPELSHMVWEATR